MTSRLVTLECARCGLEHEADRLQNRCSACGGTLLPRYELAGLDLDQVRARPPGLWRYRELLPVQGEPATLGEPETPLLFLARLSERWGTEAWLKDDSPLPGGTFKARGAAVGLARAREQGAAAIVMPSAGNAGGAWALYAARAGMPITVTMARSAPAFNQDEVRVAGGRLELVDGTISDAAARAREIASETGAFLTATFSEPYRVEGKKTAWLEIFDRLGAPEPMRFPATVVTPVGGGVAAVAAAKVAGELAEAGWVSGAPPRIVGVQAAGCAPVVAAFEARADEVEPWAGPVATAAAGLRVPLPSEGWLTLRAVRASGGMMVAVSEAEISTMVRDLASQEGVWACPEGAAAAAGAQKLAEGGLLEGPAVIYNTGAGSKYSGT